MQPSELALKHSQRCFFNSCIRDLTPEYSEQDSAFLVPVGDETLLVGVEKVSLMGVHSYDGRLVLRSAERETSLSFLEAAERLCGPHSEVLPRLHNSLRVMELMIARRSDDLRPEFLHAEQSLLIGHGFHPYPKSREEFSPEETLNYSPEFQASFPLEWMIVKKERVWSESAEGFETATWWKDLYPYPVPAGCMAYPMHPWQKDKIISHPDLRDCLFTGKTVDTKWFATSSVRSLYAPGMPYMVKFSMSLRLTNSIRHMQVSEVVRGMQVENAFQTKAGQEFLRRFPNFRMMSEPACFGLKDAQGTVLPESIILLRENPFRSSTAEAMVLATLTQYHPHHRYNLLRSFLRKHGSLAWFEAFLDEAIFPLLIAQADHGIMLGAHQQNLVLKLRDGFPVGAWFRDGQGTGFSALAVRNMQDDLKDPAKFLTHVVPADAAVVLFTYYLIINSVMNTIHAVAEAGECEEQELVHLFTEKLRQLKVTDSSVIEYLLTSPTLQQKGNFRCGQLGINENTSADPLAIYNSIPNPFYQELSR